MIKRVEEKNILKNIYWLQYILHHAIVNIYIATQRMSVILTNK